MTTVPISPIPVHFSPTRYRSQPPGAIRNIATVAGRELREATRSRWFALYTLAFAALGLGVSYVSAVGAGGAGLAGFGRTTAGLINLVLLVVSLMGLTAGAGAVASDRERGMLPYLLAQPVTRIEVMLGKCVGLGAALMACLCFGLGSCAMILAWKGEATSPGSIIGLNGLAFLLAMAMLSVGMLISVVSRKVATATGAAVFVWLAFVLVSDLGLMAGTMAFRLRIEDLFALSLLNPLQVFKMWSLQSIDGSLDVLGPAGLYASEEFGPKLWMIFAACMATWIMLPLAIASVIFSRKSPL